MGSMWWSNRFEDAEENAEVLSKKRTVTRRPPPLENISESESVEFPLDPMQSAESSEINNSRIKYPQGKLLNIMIIMIIIDYNANNHA